MEKIIDIRGLEDEALVEAQGASFEEIAKHIRNHAYAPVIPQPEFLEPEED